MERVYCCSCRVQRRRPWPHAKTWRQEFAGESYSRMQRLICGHRRMHLVAVHDVKPDGMRWKMTGSPFLCFNDLQCPRRSTVPASFPKESKRDRLSCPVTNESVADVQALRWYNCLTNFTDARSCVLCLEVFEALLNAPGRSQVGEQEDWKSNKVQHYVLYARAKSKICQSEVSGEVCQSRILPGKGAPLAR